MFIVNISAGESSSPAHNAKPGPADPLLLRKPAKQVFKFQINSLVFHQQARRQQMKYSTEART